MSTWNNKDPESWTTCTHEYRVRVEYDNDPINPRDIGDGYLSEVVEKGWGCRLDDDFNGKHDPEEQRTLFWEEVYHERGHTVYLVVNLSDALDKYKDFMTGWHTVDGKNVRKPTVGHPGRYALVQWIKKNLEAEAKEYRQWASGEVYGYIVERRPLDCPLFDDDDAGWEEVDSCWGFIGEIYEGAYASPEWYAERDAKKKTEQEALELQCTLYEEQKEIDTMARFLVGSV